ncbi:MAG TPA: hypothetical protein VNO55_02005 [Polyangia bacterium]|nr:hypothetical protein [Polyangia bacterium]
MSEDGLSAETREVLRQARLGERMPASRKRRLKGAVLARIAFASTATLAAGQATATGLFGAAVAKTVVALAVVGSLGAGSYLALRPARRHTQPQPAAPVVAAPRVEAAAAAAPAVEAPAPVSAPASRHGAIARRAPPPPASDLAAETALLRAADRALRQGDPATAMARLDEHAARFPRGALAPERAAERLIVACEVGAADPIRVDQFLATHAASPFAARVRRACAPKP